MTRSPLATPKSGHDGGERLHLVQHLGIGEFGDAAGQRRIVDQRQLIGASARDMAVERVVAGVDHGAGEPAAVKAHRGIEDLFRRLDPVDLARRLAPKAFGIGQRAGMDLVIPACSGCSWRLSRVRLLRHARACPGHPRPSADRANQDVDGRHFRNTRRGLAPAMTQGSISRQFFFICRAIVTPGAAQFKRKPAIRLALIPLNRQQMIAAAPAWPFAGRSPGRPNAALRRAMNSSCSRCRARPARGLSDVASRTTLVFTALISRSRLASSGLAQIAFSTGRRAVAQLKLGLPSTAISAPSRSSSCASDL